MGDDLRPHPARRPIKGSAGGIVLRERPADDELRPCPVRRSWPGSSSETPGSSTKDQLEKKGPDHEAQREKKPLDPAHPSYRENFPCIACDLRKTEGVVWRDMQRAKLCAHEQECDGDDDDTYEVTYKCHARLWHESPK